MLCQEASTYTYRVDFGLRDQRDEQLCWCRQGVHARNTWYQQSTISGSLARKVGTAEVQIIPLTLLARTAAGLCCRYQAGSTLCRTSPLKSSITTSENISKFCMWSRCPRLNTETNLATQCTDRRADRGQASLDISSRNIQLRWRS
jgi:hypothetical protein